MSAITGIGEAPRILRNARTAASSGTATRTISHPSRASDRIWPIVARTSRVSVLVMLCTDIGAPPERVSPVPPVPVGEQEDDRCIFPRRQGGFPPGKSGLGKIDPIGERLRENGDRVAVGISDTGIR